MADITYVRAVFGALRTTTTVPLYKIDEGVILRITGVADLPEYFEADFANRPDGTATRVMGHDGDVTIPNALLQTGLPIWCWIYVVNEITGRTVYTVKIPVKVRGTVDSADPTPEHADIITQAINALNQAGDNAEQSASDAQGYAESAESYKNSALECVQAASQYATQAARDANTASTAATNVAGSEARAKRYAQDAEVDANRAEMAAKNAGYFDVEIDARGHLIYTRTDNMEMDMNLDDRGHLIIDMGV